MEARRSVAVTLLMKLCLFCSLTLPVSRAKAVMSVRFVTFLNPSGQDESGYCCDSIFSSTNCLDSCEHTFFLCLNGRHPTEPGNCSVGQAKTGFLSENDITFTDTIGDTRNPVVMEYSGWEEFFNLTIKVYDSDDNEDDFVDSLQHNFSVERSSNESIWNQTVHLSGERTRLTLKITVYCADNYYGVDCRRHCQPTERTSCSTDGTLVCLRGKNCGMKFGVCDDRSWCKNGGLCFHGKRAYICRCPKGFVGRNCEREIASTPQTGGTTTLERVTKLWTRQKVHFSKTSGIHLGKSAMTTTAEESQRSSSHIRFDAAHKSDTKYVSHFRPTTSGFLQSTNQAKFTHFPSTLMYRYEITCPDLTSEEWSAKTHSDVSEFFVLGGFGPAEAKRLGSDLLVVFARELKLQKTLLRVSLTAESSETGRVNEDGATKVYYLVCYNGTVLGKNVTSLRTNRNIRQKLNRRYPCHIYVHQAAAKTHTQKTQNLPTESLVAIFVSFGFVALVLVILAAAVVCKIISVKMKDGRAGSAETALSGPTRARQGCDMSVQKIRHTPL